MSLCYLNRIVADVRRECWAHKDDCLVRLENKRQAESEKFINDLKESGFECCGTMENCPVRG